VRDKGDQRRNLRLPGATGFGAEPGFGRIAAEHVERGHLSAVRLYLGVGETHGFWVGPVVPGGVALEVLRGLLLGFEICHYELVERLAREREVSPFQEFVHFIPEPEAVVGLERLKRRPPMLALGVKTHCLVPIGRLAGIVPVCIPVHYCGEQFDNDGSIGSILLKNVKRVMAGEYSRELSVKVFAGQCRLIEHGFRQGGPAGFGLRRLLIDEGRNPKGELGRGDRKSLQTDRVVLTPGPLEEIEHVHRIYSMFVEEGKSEREIALVPGRGPRSIKF
jgi:hypothetical protein